MARYWPVTKGKVPINLTLRLTMLHNKFLSRYLFTKASEMTCLLQSNSFTALIAQVNNLIRLYYTSLNFLLLSIIIYMKQNDVHKAIILYLYIRGRKD